MADVFISYKQDQRQAVEQIAARLRMLGLTVWFDVNMIAGEPFGDEIDREARCAKAVLVCWSPAARESRWVKAEALIGFEQNKLAACYIAGPDGFSPPTPFNALHAEDLRTWLSAPDDTNIGWRGVLRRIGRLCARSDIESWGALAQHATTTELRAWIAAHERSPLFLTVDAILRTREERDAEQVRREQEARVRREREEAERIARQARERRDHEETERRERLAAEREREETEQIRLQTERLQQQFERTRMASVRRQQRRDIGLILCVFGAVLALGVGSWAIQNSRLEQSTRAAAARRLPEHVAFSEIYSNLDTRRLRLGDSEGLAALLTRAGATAQDAEAAVTSISAAFDPRRLRPGARVDVTLRRSEGAPAQLSSVEFRSAPGMAVTVNRISAGGFNARQFGMPLTYERTRILARVETSLHDAAVARGATAGVVAQMADVFAFDVDIQRDVRPGDPFELVFDRYYDDEGVTVRTGELSYVALTARGRLREYYRFQASGDQTPQWYNPFGRNARTNGRNLSGRELEQFHAERARIDLLRVRRDERSLAVEVRR